MKINTTRHILSIFILLLLMGIAPLSTNAQQDTAAESAANKHVTLLIGDHPGIDEVDAQSAALLIATEFRKLSINVSDPIYEAPTPAELYRVTFRRLGEKVLVHLSRETPEGTTVIERQLWIANIEEMIKVAPRLVDAIVHEKPIESTVDMESITGHEAAKPQKIAGESLWSLGIFGTFIPGTDIVAEAGYEFGWNFETSAYAVGTEFRTSQSEDFNFHAWSVGGRYFFNRNNISPYIGGGFSIFNGSYESVTEEWDTHESTPVYYEYHDSESESGLGAYISGGIEMLRFTKSRLKLELRIDRPFFRIPTEPKQDMMPITLGIFFSQHYVPGGCLP